MTRAPLPDRAETRANLELMIENGLAEAADERADAAKHGNHENATGRYCLKQAEGIERDVQTWRAAIVALDGQERLEQEIALSVRDYVREILDLNLEDAHPDVDQSPRDQIVAMFLAEWGRKDDALAEATRITVEVGKERDQATAVITQLEHELKSEIAMYNWTGSATQAAKQDLLDRLTALRQSVTPSEREETNTSTRCLSWSSLEPPCQCELSQGHCGLHRNGSLLWNSAYGRVTPSEEQS